MARGMDLLGILTSLGIAVISFGASVESAAQQIDGPEVSWRFSVWGPPRAFTAGVERLAEIVDERTGGQFTIDLAYGETLSKARENLDGIKLGAFEMAIVCNTYHPGKNPALMVLALPFLPIAGQDVSISVRKAVLDSEPVQEELSRWNAMPYASTILPAYEFIGEGEPPMTLEDWDGLRVRAGGGLSDAMGILGATPTSMPAPELYLAMQRGTIDAAAMPFTYAPVAYKIHEVADWFTANLSPGTTECPIVVNQDAYAALPEAYRKLLEEARPQVYATYARTYEEMDQNNLPMLEQKLTKITYSKEQLRRFRKQAGEPIWKDWVEENENAFDARAMLDLVLETAGEVQE